NVQDIGDHLFPQRALGSAAADLGPLNLDTQRFCNLKGVPDSEGYTFQNCLSHICSGAVHGQSDKGSSGIRIIVRRPLSHEIRQEEDVILSQLLNLCLFSTVVLCADDLVHPPFIAGSCTQHTAHQMIVTVCVRDRKSTRLNSSHVSISYPVF